VETAINELKSRKGRTSRAKGSNFERSIAKIFEKVFGIKFVRTPQSGGFAKNKEGTEDFRGDIVPVDNSINFNLHCELKNQKNISIIKWMEQSERDCPQEKEPCVIFHKHGTSINYITLNLDTFNALVNRDKLIRKAAQ
jgi:hypothetical protein